MSAPGPRISRHATWPEPQRSRRVGLRWTWRTGAATPACARSTATGAAGEAPSSASVSRTPGTRRTPLKVRSFRSRDLSRCGSSVDGEVQGVSPRSTNYDYSLILGLFFHCSHGKHSDHLVLLVRGYGAYGRRTAGARSTLIFSCTHKSEVRSIRRSEIARDRIIEQNSLN